MSSKIIIIATVVLLLASFSILFWIEAKNHTLDYKKSWSVVYFENPRDNSLDFAVENHEGRDVVYNYKVFVDGRKFIDSDIEIAAGTKQKISPVIPSDKLKGAKVMIKVSYKEKEYKICKNLGQ